MKCVINLRRRASSIGLLLTLAASGCALTTPHTDRYVAPPPGSTWVNARVDTGSYGSGSTHLPMTRGDRTWQGAPVITFETAENSLLTSPSGDYIAQVQGEKVLVTWDPPYNLDWPLRVGKTSKKNYRMTNHSANRTISYELEQTVEAYESVTTPAGTFKAFRIFSTDTLGNENTDWLSTDLGVFIKRSFKRTAKHAQGPGTREMQVVTLSLKQ
jgi:hypothetical protein